jgi:hypothetical protein
MSTSISLSIIGTIVSRGRDSRSLHLTLTLGDASLNISEAFNSSSRAAIFAPMGLEVKISLVRLIMSDKALESSRIRD